MTEEESIEAFYDRVAERYGEGVVSSPIRQHCRLPAVQSLMPDVADMCVLDAACGPGTDAAWMAERGASVLGIDASEQMVRTARERFGSLATFERANLDEPLGFLDDDRFDLVSSQLTLSHLREWDTVLSEFRRVLADDGVLVASTDHPFRQFLLARDGEFSDIDLYAQETEPAVSTENDTTDYYETEGYDLTYGGAGGPTVSFYRRPMGTYLQSFLDAGFDLADVVEPTLTEEFAREAPEAAASFRRRVPDFLCLKARPK